jgi:hypothetical protein
MAASLTETASAFVSQIVPRQIDGAQSVRVVFSRDHHHEALAERTQ